jgi:ABC-type Fe3+-hydroxamate transport system substrate-binding protein
MPATREKAVWKAVFILLLTSLALTGGSCARDGSTKVRIENVSDETLKSVVVYVTGRSYDLGAIEPHKILSVDVCATGESHVEIEHSDSDGNKQRLNVDCYLEKGSGGSVDVKVTPSSVSSVKQNYDY